jgi:DNA-binding transcriptional MerR regulator
VINERTLRRKSAAARLDISVRQLDRLTAAGIVPSFTLGPGLRLYRETDLNRFIRDAALTHTR